MQAAVLLGSDRTVRLWEFEAIEAAVASGMEITTVLHCTNDRPEPFTAKHAGYFALATASQRGKSKSRRVDVTALLADNVRILRFAAEDEGASQHIPADVTAQLEDIDVVVNFGMSQLRDSNNIPCQYGVISYHHGDPATRGVLPAGFYELSRNEAVMSIVVEQLSNAQTDGRVLAKAYSRVVPTSYRSTLNDAWAMGVPLLSQALAALEVGNTLTVASPGVHERLPTNRQTLRVVAKMSVARLGRLLYGAFREKRWNIAFVPQTFDPERIVVPNYTDLQPIQLPDGYTFAADPCAHRNGLLFAEVMHAGRGKGEIFAYDHGTWSPVDLPVDGGHLSYPQIIDFDGSTYVFPEMADVGSPTLFELDESQLQCLGVQRLEGLEDERLVDGTMLEHEDHWYLFATRFETAGERLELWVADNPLGPWELHPSSPVCLDPRSARMGGPILHAHGRMYRVGQDGSVGYGQGATISRIEKLTVDDYQEEVVSPFAIKGAFGPHTVLPTEDGYWLDYYTEKTTPMAGIRRMKGLMK